MVAPPPMQVIIAGKRGSGADPSAMSRLPTKSQSDCPEFAVLYETISRYFDPPLARSTFHDLVNDGKILPMKPIRGRYLLNASLKRLGLREVASLPGGVPKRSTEEILRLAFTAIDPLTFPEPFWAGTVEALDMKDVAHAELLVEKHREFVEELETAHERLHYFTGVLDAQLMLESEGE